MASVSSPGSRAAPGGAPASLHARARLLEVVLALARSGIIETRVDAHGREHLVHAFFVSLPFTDEEILSALHTLRDRGLVALTECTNYGTEGVIDRRWYAGTVRGEGGAPWR
jgi:hypothetical protein